MARVELGKSGAVDSELFNILKDLRKKVAKEYESASFCNFSGSITRRYGYSVSYYTG
ncbi:MAG: hypothetical protein MZV63_26260 [Marinilabiliales bacterium]|nr:hypothetical protein [Marinilabiliales bacterium]